MARSKRDPNLPDLGFTAKAYCPRARLVDLRFQRSHTPQDVFGYTLQDKILVTTPLKDVEWSMLFAYMHRRFGPPFIGGDPYKDLSAGWMITSPDPEVFVHVTPSISGGGFNFRPLVWIPDNSPPRYKVPLDVYRAAAKAYRAALIDLLRPVCQHDSYFNALGQVEGEGHPLLRQGKDEEGLLFEVPYHPGSGYAMPHGIFGDKDWPALCAALRMRGGGDYQVAKAALIEQSRQDCYAALAKERYIVKLIVAAHIFGPDRAPLLKALRLSRQDDAASADLSVWFTGWGGGKRPLPKFVPGDCKKAGRYIEWLGRDNEIDEHVVHARFWQRFKQALHGFEKAAERDGYVTEARDGQASILAYVPLSPDLDDKAEAKFAAALKKADAWYTLRWLKDIQRSYGRQDTLPTIMRVLANFAREDREKAAKQPKAVEGSERGW